MALFDYLRVFNQMVRKSINLGSYLGIAEKILLMKKLRSNQPQLFMLGLPRSGTTLVYQYIVHRLKVAYFTNGVGYYPLAPCLVTLFQKTIYGDYKSDFQSDYGKVKGAVAPREAGAFWARFFGFDDYVAFTNIAERDVSILRNTIACIQFTFGDGPFVNKNVKHMLHIDALSKIFPNSYFLIVKREMRDVAISVLRARYKNLNDPREWLSVKPPNYPELKNLSPEGQVTGQLISLQEKMEQDLSKIEEGRIIRLDYSKFCMNPEHLIETLQKTIGPLDYKNEPRQSFKFSTNEPLPMDCN